MSEQFADLRYLVADSAMCTEKLLKEAEQKGVYIVTRAPDQYRTVKKIYAETKSEDMEKIFPEDKDDQNYGRWCGIEEIGGVPCRVLCVENRERIGSKVATFERRAGKEQAKLQSEISKLSSRPAKCRPYAEKLLGEITGKCKLCKITGVEYEEIRGHTGRVRPKKDAARRSYSREGYSYSGDRQRADSSKS